jgi:arylsulfatase A-like enzyme
MHQHTSPKHPAKRLLGALFGFALLASALTAQAKNPNIILIFMDDLGHNDIGVNTYPSKETPYPQAGPAPKFKEAWEGIPAPNVASDMTPTIDRLAAEGIHMTDFYSTTICSPSRAMLMSGRYARRSDIYTVFKPSSDDGFNTAEVTLPEKLREAGYQTSMIGKWHLGYNRKQPLSFQMMPTRHGFQDFYGVPYSNDMGFFSLIEDETVVDPNVAPAEKQAELTWRFTERALERIDTHSQSEAPFFLYIAHPMTHIPCWPSDREFTNADGSTWPKFQGSSGVSYYYDVVKEVDHSTQRILQKLDDLNIADDTLVIFTSDNGPWANLKNRNMEDRAVGSAYPFNGSKMSTWEGGVRVPLIARWPGHIPAGQVNQSIGGLADFMPTLIPLVGGTLPQDRIIDGINLWPIWSGERTEIDRSFAFHNPWRKEWKAIRKGDWKLRDGRLYNLAEDIQENRNVAQNPENAAILNELKDTLEALIESADSDDNIGRGSYSDYEVQMSDNDLRIAAGQAGTVQLRLSHNPEKEVQVEVNHFSGNPALYVKSGAQLTFDANNWNQWQTIELGCRSNAEKSVVGATFRIEMNTHPVVRELFVFEDR